MNPGELTSQLMPLPLLSGFAPGGKDRLMSDGQAGEQTDGIGQTGILGLGSGAGFPGSGPGLLLCDAGGHKQLWSNVAT